METSEERDIIIISLDEIKECQQVNNTELKIQLLQYCQGKKVQKFKNQILIRKETWKNAVWKTCVFQVQG